MLIEIVIAAKCANPTFVKGVTQFHCQVQVHLFLKVARKFQAQAGNTKVASLIFIPPPCSASFVETKDASVLLASTNIFRIQCRIQIDVESRLL
jgi:16S rRNA G966 N2-methylase RsmD